MAKTSGLGDRYYVGGYDISGYTNALEKITPSVELIDVTDITQFAHSRLQGQSDGAIDITVFMNIVAGVQSTPLSSLPTADTVMTYSRGTTLGGPVACLNPKVLE